MQVKLGLDDTVMRSRSSAERMGGENVTGISVNPYGRAGAIGSTTAFMKGGPIGSIAMIALTLEGLASAKIQPNCPD